MEADKERLKRIAERLAKDPETRKQVRRGIAAAKRGRVISMELGFLGLKLRRLKDDDPEVAEYYVDLLEANRYVRLLLRGAKIAADAIPGTRRHANAKKRIALAERKLNEMRFL